MGMSAKQKALFKEQLFTLYSENWNVVRRRLNIYDNSINRDDIYICPICLKGFTREALNAKQVLTLEHIPPESVGGKNKDCILLCGKCNHTLGSRLDSHLDYRLKTADFMKKIPGSTAEARFGLSDDSIIPATLKWSEEGHLLISDDTNPRRSHPEKIERHQEEVKKFKETQKFNASFTITLGKRREWEVAMLRIAYLILFKVFGYGPITSENMHLVRTQILHPAKEILPRHWLMGEIDGIQNAFGVNIIHSPPELRSFLVVFELSTELTKDVHSVLLPAPKDTELTVYKWLGEHSEDILGTPLSLEHIPLELELISNPRLCFWSDELWSEQ